MPSFFAFCRYPRFGGFNAVYSAENAKAPDISGAVLVIGRFRGFVRIIWGGVLQYAEKVLSLFLQYAIITPQKSREEPL
jgi:hypothetical protein